MSISARNVVARYGARSKIMTAGLASSEETATNFAGEIIYTIAFPPEPDFTVMLPIPFVAEEGREYLAVNATPDCVPPEVPMSSAPVKRPLGLAPSAENSPENSVTPNAAGLEAKPA